MDSIGHIALVLRYSHDMLWILNMPNPVTNDHMRALKVPIVAWVLMYESIGVREEESVVQGGIIAESRPLWEEEFTPIAMFHCLVFEVLTVLARHLHEQLSAQRVPKEAHLVRWKQTAE